MAVGGVAEQVIARQTRHRSIRDLIAHRAWVPLWSRERTSDPSADRPEGRR
jgi:hypothetical protein